MVLTHLLSKCRSVFIYLLQPRTMGTYLEDYLESMYMLPSEIKRNFDLMRELDKVACVCVCVHTTVWWRFLY